MLIMTWNINLQGIGKKATKMNCISSDLMKQEETFKGTKNISSFQVMSNLIYVSKQLVFWTANWKEYIHLSNLGIIFGNTEKLEIRLGCVV